MAQPFSMAPDFSWVDEGSDPVQAAAEAAAARQANAVRSHYGRPEGKATATLDALGTGVYNAAAKPSRIWGALAEVPMGQPLSERPDIVDAVAQTATDLIGAPGVMGGMGKAGQATLGIVPVNRAREFPVPFGLPQDETFAAAVRNTPGAAIDEGMLRMPVARRQHPDQEMSESVRGGVFYLPAGSENFKHYTGRGGYGGSQKIEGETGFKNANEFLDKHAPEMSHLADYIVQNSKNGNQLPYALQEAAVASAARKAGHDGVIGYSTSRKTKEPFISEVYDVRESRYPSPAGDYQTWPASEFKLGANAADKKTGAAVVGADLARDQAPMSMAPRDTGHLSALELRLSHERDYLRGAKTDQEKQLRQVWIDQIQKEIDGERKFLGIKEQAPLNITDDELLAELGGK